MTKKQRRFVEEYLIDLNATQAAIRAGYKAGNAQRASEIGCELLKKTQVSEAIQQAMAERSKRTGVNAERVVMELAKIGFARITDIIDPETAEIREDASEEDLACIQSVKIKPGEFGTEREIKMYDKKSALELLGKHLGMWNEKLEVKGAAGVVIINDIPRPDDSG